MMKKITYPLILASLLAFAGCTNEDGDVIDKSGPPAIELGGLSNKTMSRAGFTEAETTLKVHYVSTRKASDAGFPYNDGMKADGITPKGTLYMTSTANANIDNTKTAESVSKVIQGVGNQRYWDDLHGKNSILSLYAIAVPNKTSITKNAGAFNAWDNPSVKEGTETPIANTIVWSISTNQTRDYIADEDLAYSNNVTGDNTLGFNTSTSKFEKAEDAKTLLFNHALTRLTINVTKGAGFGDFADEFNVTTVKIAGVTTSGTLNVEDGTISSPTTDDVEIVGTQTQDIYKVDDVQKGYSYQAQIFPGKEIYNVDATLLTIVVDGNNYYIKGSEIYNALKSINPGKEEELKSLKAGVNYKLAITINKKNVIINSAKLVDWNEITAETLTPSNAISLETSMEQSGNTTQTTIASDLYRSTSLTTGYYGNMTTLAADNVLGTAWYWPNNDTKYFFRTISPQGTSVTDADPCTVTMTGGAIATNNDFIWGAPLEETHPDGTAAPHSFDYANGYTAYLYPAIGATESQIHITQFHMMSNLQVNLTTSEGEDKVDLSDATVEVQNFYNTATLALSNALVTTTGEKVATQAITANSGHTEHTWRVIPQSTSGIKFKITAEGNVYTVDLSQVLSEITEWVPGKAYVYSFKLTKTGIKITSAKLVDWSTVTATNKDITLES